MKISNKLILIISILVVISIVVIGTVCYFLSKQSIKERVESQLESVSILKRNQFENFMKRMSKDLENLAQDVYNINFLLNSEGINNSQEIDWTDYTANIRQQLEQKLTRKEDFSEFFIIDLDGLVQASTDKNQEKKFKSSEPYFNKGKEGSFVQYFYYDLALQESTMVASTPIKNAEGEVIAVFAGRVDLDEISEFMVERSGLGETGETYLVNKFNMVVTGLRGEEKAALRKLIQTEGVKGCLERNEGFDYYDNYQKTPVVGYYLWIPKSEICLLTEINQAEALLPIRKLGFLITLISSAAILLIIILSIFLSKTITDPIFKLRNATVEIGKGKLDTRIDIKSKDEVGELAIAFNQMTDDLKKSRSDLKKYSEELKNEVEDRTKALKEKIDELENFNKISVGRELKMVELKKRIKELEEERKKKVKE